MIRAAAVCAALALPAADAAAQDCALQWAAAANWLETTGYENLSQSAPADTVEGCRVEGLSLRESGLLQVDVGQIVWTVTGLEPLLAGDPTAVVSVDISVTAARVYPVPDDEWLAWMLEVQNRRHLIDGRLRAEWDPATGRLDVGELSVDLPGRNGVHLALRAAGAGPVMAGLGPRGPDRPRLLSLDLTVDNEGFAESTYLGILAERMRGTPGGPAVAEEQLRQAARDWVRALPRSVFSPSARSALARLAEHVPSPWGRIRLSLRSEAGLNMPNLREVAQTEVPFAPDRLADALAGVQLTLDYAPWAGRE